MGKKVQSHSDQYTSHWPCFKTDTLPMMKKQGHPKPMKKISAHDKKTKKSVKAKA